MRENVCCTEARSPENRDARASGGAPAWAGRAEWMGLLARASEDELESAWQTLSAAVGDAEGYVFLRPPETGLVMVQGRAGGDGRPFNLGEMTVTRCTVRLSDGTVGHGYVAGRSRRHAELAAVLDGYLQSDGEPGARAAEAAAPLRASAAAAALDRAAKTAATKVEFFTLVREQGGEE